MLREWEFQLAQLAQLGFIPGECHIFAKGSGVPYGFWRDNRRVPSAQLHTSLSNAYAAVGRMNGNNNTIFVSPDSHTLPATNVFDKNMTHLVGMYPAEARMNHRTRLTQGATGTPFVTVSGYGNLFKGLYFEHGTAAADYVGLYVSGNRNTFVNCYLNSPVNAALGSDTNLVGLQIGGAENYFKNCTFGNHTVALDEASALLKFDAGNGINIFENCIFLMRCTDTDPYFIHVVNTTDTGMAIFKNCTFIADPGTAGTPAIACYFAGASMGYLYFDPMCQFINVTNISATTKDQYLRLATVLASTDDDVGMIATTPALD